MEQYLIDIARELEKINEVLMDIKYILSDISKKDNKEELENKNKKEDIKIATSKTKKKRK